MKLSIIVPVYNVEQYLQKCVDSILAQTFTDFECFLIDDGSTDSCPKMCDEYAEKDSRIKVIHTENGGASIARNVGLDLAIGDFIGFVDSDDFIQPDMYEELFSVQGDTGAEIVASQFTYIKTDYSLGRHTSSDTSTYKVFDCKDIFENFSQRMLGFGGVLWNKIYKRDLFENLRFLPELKRGEDHCMLMFLYHRCEKIALTDRCLYNYYSRPNSLITSPYNYHNRVSEIDKTNIQMEFFSKVGCESEADAALFEYVGWYIPNHIHVYTDHKQYKNDFAPYVKQAKKRFFKILTNPKRHTAKKRVIVFVVLFISPKLAKKLFKKYCDDAWWKM